ncbi:hypothetical protein TL16_g01119, partial [Triparma laevis f. inornata]
MSSDSAPPSPFQFGPFTIPSETVFHSTTLSTAFVNLRPIVPGHVLICPKRSGVLRMQDLSEAEYLDLWSTVRTVQSMIESTHSATGSNVAVQDGKSAGQSVPHVHVHVLPRKGGDFESNDDVYEEIEGWGPWKGQLGGGDKMEVPDDADRKDRTIETMIEEATRYRSLIETEQS